MVSCHDHVQFCHCASEQMAADAARTSPPTASGAVGRTVRTTSHAATATMIAAATAFAVMQARRSQSVAAASA